MDILVISIQFFFFYFDIAPRMSPRGKRPKDLVGARGRTILYFFITY